MDLSKYKEITEKLTIEMKHENIMLFQTRMASNDLSVLYTLKNRGTRQALSEYIDMLRRKYVKREELEMPLGVLVLYTNPDGSNNKGILLSNVDEEVEPLVWRGLLVEEIGTGHVNYIPSGEIHQVAESVEVMLLRRSRYELSKVRYKLYQDHLAVSKMIYRNDEYQEDKAEIAAEKAVESIDKLVEEIDANLKLKV